MRGKQYTPLFICLLGLPIIRNLAGRARNGEQQPGKSFNKSVSSPTLMRVDNSGKIADVEEEKREPETQEDEPDGGVLVIDLYTLDTRENVRAVVDTGAGITLIHKKFAVNIFPLNKDLQVQGGSNVNIQIFGGTTIDVCTKNGEKFSVTGIVANHPFGILIGNNFNVLHATKINIPEGTMSIVYHQREIKMTIQFIQGTDLIAALDTDLRMYSPLRVFAKVNGYNTKIMIDTAATRSVVRKSYVKRKNIRRTDVEMFLNEDTKVNPAGKTDITVLIGGTQFSTTAFIPKFSFTESLILGTESIRPFVELIDFEKKTVTFVPFGNNDRTAVKMIGI